MGLRNKLFIQHAVIIVMLLAVMYFIVNHTLSRSMIERDTQTLSQYFALHRIEVLKIVNDKKIDIEQLFSGAYAPLIASHLAANSNFQVQLFDAEETIVGNSEDMDNLLKRGDIGTALAGQTATVLAEADDTRYLIYAAPFWYEGKIVGGFRYLLNLNQHMETLAQMRYWFIGVALGCLLISLLASYSIFSILMKPLHDLKQALKRVSVGDFSKRVTVNSRDEIHELANNFNQMSDALEQHIAMLRHEQGKQKAFYDNMTHEFKTPLTSIIGFSELIAKLDRLDDIRTCSGYIRRESVRLLDMMEELLQTSLKGNEAWSVRLERAELSEVIADSLRILKPTLDKSSIETRVEVAPCEVYLDPARTRQVLFNVIDNAIKHSQCTRLRIAVDEREGRGRVRIADNGKGIPERDLTALFAPSEQRSSRVISAQSHGLGLSLCKQLMELQGGSIRIESRVHRGTEVELLFNLYNPM
ncbi:ATP-binding protein [Paenibacillus thermoaerophilus]|uniref:histidine kinase n=1 Tax=Paenibacillus thermoaerophilus TaxID=1215385 RepID=A0ABW2V7W9_9BACL|nr:HAMP domain-containing sensor histidine kinase [Paenibacillus thermoaerophilus]